jgi:GTP-binding protein Era
MGSDRQSTPSTTTDNPGFRAGTIALAGRSNVGKSTLLNRFIGFKVAIESEKPQATRGRVLGIRTLPEAQLVWLDLPGIHRASSPMNKRMVEIAHREIQDADVVAVVIDGAVGLHPGDKKLIQGIKSRDHRWLIVLNKIDRLKPPELLEQVTEIHGHYPGIDIVPVSAREGRNLPELERTVATLLPLSPMLYPEDETTNQTERQIVQELVREKVFEVTSQEVPYRVAVIVESFQEEESENIVHAQILVESESQKRILVGKGGSMIREIGTRARIELERSLGRRLYLKLFVKVRRGWTTDARALEELEIGR